MELKPKLTLYNEYFFRSKLEAKWAVFFDLLHVPYQYEPNAYRCDDGSQYTPDFYLPEAYLRSDRYPKGLYLEIKPIEWKQDQAYSTRIASAFKDKANLVLFRGDPLDVLSKEDLIQNEQLCPHWDDCMLFMYCDKCTAFKAEFYEGNYFYCPECGGNVNSKRVMQAGARARQFKFYYVK